MQVTAVAVVAAAVVVVDRIVVRSQEFRLKYVHVHVCNDEDVYVCMYVCMYM